MTTPQPTHHIKVSVVFTTYNSVEWLEKVLLGFFQQSYSSFEIVVADDGSTEETRRLVQRMRTESPVPIVHVWQPDAGFQKCRILNKAVLASSGDYLIFTDGDCIPRSDFVEQHVRNSEQDRFLSGGYFKLPMNISRLISREDIRTQRVFDLAWLRSLGLPRSEKNLKLLAKGWVASFLNALSPAKASWNGHNASCFKKHILAANGFDERMQYGGEDREFGERLVNMGLRGKRIRYTAICVHLDHKRGYVKPEMLLRNAQVRRETAKNKVVRAVVGLSQYADLDPHEFIVQSP